MAVSHRLQVCCSSNLRELVHEHNKIVSVINLLMLCVYRYGIQIFGIIFDRRGRRLGFSKCVSLQSYVLFSAVGSEF